MTRLPISAAQSLERARTLRALQAFVRIPSISAQPQHAPAVRRCAAWLGRYLREIGLGQVTIAPTARHPIVYGNWLGAPGRPTVLIYGHYDVQPADPLTAWRIPPFAAEIRGEHLYGRGATDDKGQLFAHLVALQTMLERQRTLPVNVHCLFEGEEEIGSPHLPAYLRSHQRQFRADVAVISDTRMLGPSRPALTYALRGNLGMELEVRGPPRDLHSGNYGGAIHNPLQALCELITGLHDAAGRVAIPGFYDDVRHWDAEERAFMAHCGPSDAQILHDAGARRAWGERGFSLYERTTIRPALTLNGISGGYAGPGMQGIIPSRALAKIGIRLVPDQEPREIARLFQEHVARLAPRTVSMSLRVLGMARPALIDRCDSAMRAAAFAYRCGFGADPVYLRSGGTIPVAAMFQEILGLPTVLMGFALPDAQIHAANERLHLPTFFRSIAACQAFLGAVGRQGETRAATG